MIQNSDMAQACISLMFAGKKRDRDRQETTNEQKVKEPERQRSSEKVKKPGDYMAPPCRPNGRKSTKEVSETAEQALCGLCYPKTHRYEKYYHFKLMGQPAGNGA